MDRRVNKALLFCSLNLKLKNFPILISPRSYLFTKPNFFLRKELSLQVEVKNKFESFFLAILKDLIPCSFLENYKMITNFIIEKEKQNGLEIIKIKYDEFQNGNYNKAMELINEYKTKGFLIDFNHLCPITQIRTIILNKKKLFII